MKTHYIYICAALMTSLSAAGQQLEREVTIDRQIEPAPRAFSRPGIVSPSTLSPSVKASPLRQAEYTGRGTLSRSLTRLEPAAYADTFEISPYRGYVSAGYLPAFNLGVSAGYSLISDKNTHLGVMLQYNGSSHHGAAIPLDDGVKKLDARRQLFTIGFDAAHRFNTANAIDMAFDYSLGLTSTPDVVRGDSQSQTANMVNLDLGYHHRGSLPLNLGLDVEYMGYGKDQYAPPVTYDADLKVKPASQTIAGLTADVAWHNWHLGLDARLSHLGRTRRLYPAAIQQGHTYVPSTIYYDYGAETSGIIALKPAYSITGDKYTLSLGLDVSLLLNDPDNNVHLAPAVDFTWSPSGTFALWARATGGDTFNSLQTLYRECPWMPSIYSYGSTYAPVIADAGINIGPFGGFSAGLYGGYAVANNALMPYIVTTPAAPGYTHTYCPTDMRGARYGLKLQYDWRGLVKVHADIEGASHGAHDSGYYLSSDRAKYSLKAGIEAQPVEALSLSADFALRTSRRLWVLTPGCTGDFPLAWYDAESYVTLGNIADLSVGADYRLSEPLSIFGRLSNLLCRRHTDIAGIASQRIGGLIGISYKF